MLKPKIITDHSVAYNSPDHLYPYGTINDNTKNEDYVNKLISIFGKDMKYMDLGCAGGGFVSQFLERDIFAIGIEGSDRCLKEQKFEWEKYKNYLFTADIEYPFKIVDENDQIIQFDVISAFDVLEHIRMEAMDTLFETVKLHLKPKGWFITGIALFPHLPYHLTVGKKEWWYEMFLKHKFVMLENVLEDNFYGRKSTLSWVHERE